MNKEELVNQVTAMTPLKKQDVNKALDAIVGIIMETVAEGGVVRLSGFGTFGTKLRKERQGINPATKEPLTIPAKTVPVFSAGKEFKEQVKVAAF